MKNLLLGLALIVSSLTFAHKKCNLTINYEYAHIEVGYDLKVKCLVYIDDVLVGESQTHLQSQKQSFNLKVPRKNHQIKIIIMCLYNGVWEEQLVANDYSTDAQFIDEIVFGKAQNINLLFDLDKSQPTITF